MVFVRRPFFHYDPARCGMPTLYGTVSGAAKTIRFNTLWQWKGYVPQGYIRPVHSRNFTTAMQDPDGAAAFCHHHNIMTNVSFNSPKLEEKYRPSCKNELETTNE